MGEREHYIFAEDRSLVRSREAAHLAPSSEAATVPSGDRYTGERSAHGGRDSLMEQTVGEREAVKRRPSVHEPTGKSPLLAAFAELYIAKELYRAEVEKRKEQQRTRAEKWRKEHPETHRARSAEAMRKIRAEAKQQAESA
jgi:hypothetical protein